MQFALVSFRIADFFSFTLATKALVVLASGFALAPAFAQDLTNNRPTLSAEAVPLDWRKIKWPPFVYNRVGLGNGAAFYTFPSKSAQKFRFDLVFKNGVHSFPPKKRPELSALVDMMLEGGSQSKTFEQIQRLSAKKGLRISTSLTSAGYIRLTAEALSSDFDAAMDLLEEILLKPAFRSKAFATWKRKSKSSFDGLLDASSPREQYRLMGPELVKITLGPKHFFADSLHRSKPSRIDSIDLDEVKKMHKEVIRSKDLVSLLSGGFSSKQRQKAQKLLQKVPQRRSKVKTWLPDRLALPASDGVHVVIINKKDMPQSSIFGRLIWNSTGELNDLEKIEFQLAQEVFSSSAGVVGEDRFSGAMRKESGLSYSPYSYPNARLVQPNTNVTGWNFVFQTPVDKTAEGLSLAWKTWKDFQKKGITAAEFKQTRTIMMNKMLARERTVFQKAEGLLGLILRGKLPSTSPEEELLLRFEALKSHNEVNDTLKRITSAKDSRFGYVIMGGLSDKQRDAIEDLDFVKNVKVISFESLTQSLK